MKRRLIIDILIVALTFGATSIHYNNKMDKIEKEHIEYIDSIHEQYFNAFNCAAGDYFYERKELNNKQRDCLLKYLNEEYEKVCPSYKIEETHANNK